MPRPDRREYFRQRRWEIKLAVLHHYGGRCECCGVDHPEFLCIDHIDGGGNDHRKEIGGGAGKLYEWLIKNDYPEGFQVLCYNCNYGKERGLCPTDRCKSLDRL